MKLKMLVLVKMLTYDKLIMNVYTNGSIRPEEAMALAAKILIEHFKYYY